MSISMETLALAKKYTDEHGGGGGQPFDPTKYVGEIDDVGSVPNLKTTVTGKNLKIEFTAGEVPGKNVTLKRKV